MGKIIVLLTVLIPVLLIAYTVWATIRSFSKNMKSRKLWLKIITIEAMVIIGFITYYYWPRGYERTYLNNQKIQDTINLKSLANAKNFYIGTIGTHPIPDLIVREFNSCTPPNLLKWPHLIKDENILGEYDFSAADSIVNEALEKGLRIRGHALIWGNGYYYSPYPKIIDKIVMEADNPKEKLIGLMKSHIHTTMHHFKDRVHTWDVVNEPLKTFGDKPDENIFYKTLGTGFMVDAFKMAREAYPTAILFLNEQFFEYDGDKAKAFIRLVEELLDKGAPIDGIGIQAHHIFDAPNVQSFKNLMVQLSNMGLKIEVTEFEVSLRNFSNYDMPYEAQGKFYEEFLKACVDNPNCIGFTMWGYNDKNANKWMPFYRLFMPYEPFPWDDNSYKKPAYYGMVKALFN